MQNITDIPKLMQAGMDHHRSGRLRQAQVNYQQILGLQPGNLDAAHLLGLSLHQMVMRLRVVI